jgi:hypothetical protein
MGLKLGDISPLAGVLSGEGAIGKLADKGLLGLGPRMIASKAQEKDEAKVRQAEQAEAEKSAAMEKEKKAAAMEKYVSAARVPTGGMEGYKGYKKGGKVKSASARADGCAIRGKTKA